MSQLNIKNPLKLSKKGSNTPMMLSSLVIKSCKALVVGVLVISASGCSVLNIGSGDYGCPGMPDGVQCMSARDVYTETNDGNVPRSMTKKEAKKEAKKNKGDSSTKNTTTINHGDSVINTYVAPNLPNKPIPIRTPAQVMRIWVAPWEDTNGDLITTGYIYTEIEARKWVIGEEASQGKVDPVFKPLESK